MRVLDPDLMKHYSCHTDEEVAASIHSLQNDEELLHQVTVENTSNNDGEMIDDKSTNGVNREKAAEQKTVTWGNRFF